jgi:hypothetical protein
MKRYSSFVLIVILFPQQSNLFYTHWDKQFPDDYIAKFFPVDTSLRASTKSNYALTTLILSSTATGHKFSLH